MASTSVSSARVAVVDSGEVGSSAVYTALGHCLGVLPH
jgi:hypothetical protein